MRHEINRTDHIADMADVLAICPAGACMNLRDIESSALACLDALDLAPATFDRVAWRLECYIADESPHILQAVQSVSREDAEAEEFPLQLVIYGARELIGAAQ